MEKLEKHYNLSPETVEKLKTQIAILADGTVVPCCLDSNGIINLGNIYTESIEEIQNKERYQNLKKSFQDRKPSEKICKSCTFKEKKYN